MTTRSRLSKTLLAVTAAAIGTLACASPPDPMRYRLAGSGDHWDTVGNDRVFEDVQPRYAAFFAVILDPAKTHDPNLKLLRDDLEHRPVDRRNFDALNAVAIAYFELNYRAETELDQRAYLRNSFRAAKLLAVPWRAYMEVEDPRLREAILDFFEDAASGEKLESANTAGRLARIVSSLEAREPDPDRRARIRELATRIEVIYGIPYD